jgi:hypothetical protein
VVAAQLKVENPVLLRIIWHPILWSSPRASLSLKLQQLFCRDCDQKYQKIAISADGDTNIARKTSSRTGAKYRSSA